MGVAVHPLSDNIAVTSAGAMPSALVIDAEQVEQYIDIVIGRPRIYGRVLYGIAQSGTRTRTNIVKGILSPLCLPVPPLGLRDPA